jgi:peptidoglycan/xylan/chitin deacetylase (PgdA/CDA1 family)
MYHHIHAAPSHIPPEHRSLWVPPEQFAGHLGWLAANGYQGLTLAEVFRALHRNHSLPRRWVCLSFDDARKDNLIVGAPLAEKFGFPMTIFAVSSWTSGLPCAIMTPEAEEATCSLEELQILSERGHLIGSHTHTHPKLTRLNDDQVRQELITSRKELAEVTGSPPDFLAYPFGNTAPRIIKIAAQCGYQAAVATIRDNRVSLAQIMALPRVMIHPETPPWRLAYLFSPLYSWIHRWKNLRRWTGLRKG